MPSVKLQSLNKVTLRHDNISTSYLIGDIVEGYYFGGEFYLDSSHTQLVEGAAGYLYISLNENKQYRYDTNAQKYVVISGSGGGGGGDSGLDIYADDTITAIIIDDGTTIFIYPVDPLVAMVVNGGSVNDETQTILLFTIGANEENALVAG